MVEIVRFQYEKLVRDKVLDGMEASGAVVKVRYLKGHELEAALVEKLHEELDEVHDDDSDMITEIGDVLEVIRALEKDESLSEKSKSEIEKVQEIIGQLIIDNNTDEDSVEAAHVGKYREKGNFSLGAYVEYVDVRDDDPFFGHLKASPEKYPILEK